MRRYYLIIALVILLAIASAASAASAAIADGPVIWKMHCPAHHNVLLVPAADWGGVHVMCIRAALEADR